MRLLIAALIFTSLGFSSSGLAEPLRILPHACWDHSYWSSLQMHSLEQKRALRSMLVHLETLLERRVDHAQHDDAASKRAVEKLDRQIFVVEKRLKGLRRLNRELDQRLSIARPSPDHPDCWRPRLSPYQRSEGLI